MNASLPVNPPLPPAFATDPESLERAGLLAGYLFATTFFPTHPDLRLIGPRDPEPDDMPAQPDRPSLPAVLTFRCFDMAKELGIRLRPGVLVTYPMGILLQLRWPRDANGVMTIGMARLAMDLIRGMFAAMESPPPPLLTLDEAAALVRVAPNTLSHMVCDGRIIKSVKRGKPLIFIRDLLVQEFMANS